jgi:hypothetical protein
MRKLRPGSRIRSVRAALAVVALLVALVAPVGQSRAVPGCATVDEETLEYLRSTADKLFDLVHDVDCRFLAAGRPLGETAVSRGRELPTVADATAAWKSIDATFLGEVHAELTALGGTLRIREDGIHGGGFSVDAAGKPWIELSVRAGQETLVHERSHLRDFLELKRRFEGEGKDALEAARLAIGIIFSPAGMHATEARAILVEAEFVRTKLSERQFTNFLLHVGNYPALQALLHVNVAGSRLMASSEPGARDLVNRLLDMREALAYDVVARTVEFRRALGIDWRPTYPTDYFGGVSAEHIKGVEGQAPLAAIMEAALEGYEGRTGTVFKPDPMTLYRDKQRREVATDLRDAGVFDPTAGQRLLNTAKELRDRYGRNYADSREWLDIVSAHEAASKATQRLAELAKRGDPVFAEVAKDRPPTEFIDYFELHAQLHGIVHGSRDRLLEVARRLFPTYSAERHEAYVDYGVASLWRSVPQTFHRPGAKLTSDMVVTLLEVELMGLVR